MKKIFLSLRMILSASLCFTIISCANNSSNEGKNGNVRDQQKLRINFDAIPSQYHPEVSEEKLQTDNIERIYIDMFGFKNDVEVVYSDSLSQGQGFLKIYTVIQGRGSIGNFSATTKGTSLKLDRFGEYQCSIKTDNNNITELKGLCIIRLQIFLPKDSEIEVYNLQQLISKRFRPIDAEAFIDNFTKATFKEEKVATIDEYLSSYNGMNKTPQLTSNQLGIVVKVLSWRNEQFEALRKLNIYVVDRENLGAMIDKEISYFDREEARRICGL